MSRLTPGRIIWSTVPDPQGRNPKSRPLVIIATEGDMLGCVACSTQTDQAPASVQVPIPWMRQGHPRTKLRTETNAVCNWYLKLSPSAVEEEGGIVPPQLLFEIRQRAQELKANLPSPDSQSANPDTPPAQT